MVSGNILSPRVITLALVAVTMFIALLAVSLVASGDAADGPIWSTLGGDAYRTGTSPVDTTGNWGSLLWTHDQLSGVASQLLIDHDGTMYYRDSGGEIFLLEPDGTPTYGNDQAPGELWGEMREMTLAPDGTIVTYKRGSDRGLCAVHADGTLEWAFNIPDWGMNTMVGPPTVAPNGTAYFVTSNDTLFALLPNGTLKWQRTVEGLHYDAATTLGRSGEVIVRGEAIDVFGPDGTHLWQHMEPSPFVGAVAVGEDGTAYAVTASGRIVALGRTGNLVWSHDMDAGCYCTPSLGPDGTVHVGSHGGLMYALNADGNLKWTFDTHSNITSSATVSAEGTVYFSCRTEDFYAVRSDGTLKWVFRANAMTMVDIDDFYVNYAVGTAPVIASDGTVLFGCEGDVLYALGDTLQEGSDVPLLEDVPCDSPWPVDGGSVGNRGYFDDDLLLSDSDEVWRVNRRDFGVLGTKSTWTTDPIVGSNGTILIGSGDVLFAITPGGERDWTYQLTDEIVGTVSVSGNGTIFLCCADGTVWSLSRGGELIWSIDLGSQLWFCELTRSGNGILYVTAMNDPSDDVSDSYIFAINPDSSIRWSMSTGAPMISTPTAGPDGAVYFTTITGNLYKVSPSGEIQWVHVFSHEEDSRTYMWHMVMSSLIVVGPDGVVYLTYLDRLYVIGPDGSALWAFEADEGPYPGYFYYPSMPEPALRKGGDIILGGNRGTLYCISSGGELVWSTDLGSKILEQPIVGRDGRILVITEDTLFAINQDGSQAWNATYMFIGGTTGPMGTGHLRGYAPGGNDTLYLVDTDGNLRAVGTEPSPDGSTEAWDLVLLVVMVGVLLVILVVVLLAIQRKAREEETPGQSGMQGPR